MVGHLKTYVNDAESFVANIISKSGRNEVQIYPINKSISSSSEIIKETSIVKIELEAEENIVDVVWFESPLDTVDTPKKRGKRKQVDSDVATPSTNISSTLAVLIENGDILLFSPLQDKIVKRISNETKLSNLTTSPNHPNSIFATVQGSSTIIEISLETNKTVKSVKFKQDEEIKIAKAIQYKGHGLGAKPLPMILGSKDAYFVDIFKAKPLIKAFPSEETEQITAIKQSNIHQERFYFIRENHPKFYMYNINQPESLNSYQASTTIDDLQIISSGDQEIAMAITSDGVQTFNIDFVSANVDHLPSGLIKTNNDSIVFSNVLYSGESLTGIWYDLNQPKFVLIDWKFNSIGEIMVPINYIEKSIENTANPSQISIPKSKDIKNLSTEVLYDQLYTLLTSRDKESEDIDNQVVQICSTNDDSFNIKETIRLFSTSDFSSLLANNLFEIISKEISLDPSTNSSLSIWLKWILLAHGGSIAREPTQNENLKNLQNGLISGMKLMPHLSALQGRLQLLKTQAQLRKQMAEMNVDNLQDVNVENEVVSETKEDEKMIYANGENDDDFDVSQVGKVEEVEEVKEVNEVNSEDDDEE
jgi:U3 small nucleolar RNA-associated protein 9